MTYPQKVTLTSEQGETVTFMVESEEGLDSVDFGEHNFQHQVANMWLDEEGNDWVEVQS